MNGLEKAAAMLTWLSNHKSEIPKPKGYDDLLISFSSGQFMIDEDKVSIDLVSDKEHSLLLRACQELGFNSRLG